MEIAQLTHH